MENGIDMIIIQLNHNKNMRVILILIILFSSFVFKIDNAIEASKEKSVMSGTVEGKSATFTVINKNNTMYLRVDTLLITVTNKKRED